MTCPECNIELPEGADYCPTCQAQVQTTGLTEESPHEVARPPEFANKTRRSIPQPEEHKNQTELENAVTRGDSIVQARWLDRRRIREWANNRLNHYEVLGLDRNADEQILQSRIASLDRALEQWSKEHDAGLQEVGKEGKRQLLRLKAAFEDRAAYDHKLEAADRQRMIEELTQRALDDVRTSGLLKWLVWERLQRQARDKGLDSEGLDQVLHSLRNHGIQTELVIEGRAVRSFDDLLAVCDGQGERLIEVFYGGELERWLKDYFPVKRVEELVRLKNRYSINTHLGAQILLWELGEERLVLEEEGHRCQIVSVEQWIKETCYHERQDRAELAFNASLRALWNQILETWLDRVRHRRAGGRARQERMNASGRPGLWLVIWEAEREAGLRRIPSETAYGRTKKLVSEYSDFPAGHFNHAINCVLSLRLEEMVTHLRKAIEINPEYAKRALSSPYFERHRQEVGRVVDSIAAGRPVALTVDPDKRSRHWFRDIPRPVWWSLAVLLAIVLVWAVWPPIYPTIEQYDFDSAVPRPFKEKHEGGVATLAFVHGGAVLVTGGWKKEVNLWDVENREIRQSLKINGPEARAIAVSSDGKLLATVSKEIRVISLWDLHAGIIRIYSQSEDEKSRRGIPLVINNRGESSKRETVAPRAVRLGMRLDQELRTVAFSPNNQFLAGAGESQVKLWYLKSEQEIQFSGEEAHAPIAFSPDSKWLASGGPVVTLNNGVREQQTVIWDLPSGQLELLRLGRDLSNAKPAGKFSVKHDDLGAIAFSMPDGRWLASGCERYKAAIWDVESVKKKYTHESEATPEPVDMRQISLPHNPKRLIVVAFSPAGDKLVTVGEGEKTFKLWTWNETSLVEITFQNPAGAGNVTSAAFSDNGRLLAIGYDDGTVKVWEGRARQK